jgi:hypothetical protein
MCFSPEASFAVGSALAVIGAATIRKALRVDRSMLGFAVFPAIFSLHQFTEGFVWLSLNGGFNGVVFRYLYILIAVLLWPFLSPLASFFAEPARVGRPVRYALLAAGLMVTGYLAYKLANASGIDVDVVGHSLSYVIRYDTPLPEFANYAYAAVAILPLLVIRNSVLTVLAALAAVSFFYTLHEMREVWYSVWCLSAAVFSGLLYVAVGSSAKAQTR